MIKEIILKLLKEKGIEPDDIIKFEPIQFMAEGTNLPRMYFNFTINGGEKIQIYTPLSIIIRHKIQSQGITIVKDVEDFNKFLQRKINLNILL